MIIKRKKLLLVSSLSGLFERTCLLQLLDYALERASPDDGYCIDRAFHLRGYAQKILSRNISEKPLSLFQGLSRGRIKIGQGFKIVLAYNIGISRRKRGRKEIEESSVRIKGSRYEKTTDREHESYIDSHMRLFCLTHTFWSLNSGSRGT